MRFTSHRATLVSSLALSTILFAGAATALEPDGSVAIRLPRGVSLRNVSISARGTINLGDRSVVVGRTPTVGAVVNAGAGQTNVGVTGNVGPNVVSVPKLSLSNYAKIQGSVYTTTTPSRQAGATIVGSVIADAKLTPVNVVDWQPPPEATASNFTVYPDQTGSLSAGNYQDVVIYSRAKVSFGPGVYRVRTLDIEPQAAITFDVRSGPIVIYVSKSLLLKAVPTILGSTANLGIVYLDENAVTLESPFSGAVLAPYAQLRLAASGSKNYVGQFIGKDVVVDPDVRVTYNPFNWNAVEPLLADDSSTAMVNNGPFDYGKPFTCSAASFSGTRVLNPDGTAYYTSLNYVTPDPSAGVCAPNFVDAAGNLIVAPTPARLTSPPLVGSTCAAFPASTDHCPIEPSTLTSACTTDADCGAGEICAVHCTTMECDTYEYRCGTPAPTCEALPAEGSCEDFQLAPVEGAIGTPNVATLDSAFATTTTPSPSGVIVPSQQTVPPTSYSPVSAELCSFPAYAVGEVKDGSNKPAEDGNGKWGIYLTPTSGLDLKMEKSADRTRRLNINLHGGFVAGGIVFGQKIEVLNGDARAVIDDCGLNLGASIKLFGETIVAWTPAAADSIHLVTDGNYLTTPKVNSDACKSERQRTYDTILKVRRANLLARAFKQYYLSNGLTPQLCEQIKADIPGSIDPSYDCSTMAGDPVGQVNVLNAWQTEYQAWAGKYIDFSSKLEVAQMKTHFSGTAKVIDKHHEYHLHLLNQYYPIGPITLNLAVEGFGGWRIKGGIQYGVGFDWDPGSVDLDLGAIGGIRNFGSVRDAFNRVVSVEPPTVGDIRAWGGPVVTPSLQVGVLAFAGVGIPGVSVGIQGQVNLLSIAIPAGVVGTAMRVSSNDPRSVAGTDYDGAPVAGMESKQYRWLTGYTWDSRLDLTALDGQMDIAARIRFLGFSKTFKQKIFSWPGITKSWNLVTGSDGGAMKYGNHFGKQADDIAYTQLAPITTGIRVEPTGPDAPTCPPYYPYSSATPPTTP